MRFEIFESKNTYRVDWISLLAENLDQSKKFQSNLRNVLVPDGLIVIKYVVSDVDVFYGVW